jgi:hypothetical protein
MNTGGDISVVTSQSQTALLLAEYARPWKIFTLAVGIGLLILGSYCYEALNWDIPISLIMAILTYLTAPWSLRVIMERTWRIWPTMLFATWFTVDGSYWLYWHFKNPVALELMRGANFLASLTLYGICGLLWLYRCSLRQLASEIGTRFCRPSGDGTQQEPVQTRWRLLKIFVACAPGWPHNPALAPTG